jgi:hypothetical protein
MLSQLDFYPTKLCFSKYALFLTTIPFSSIVPLFELGDPPTVPPSPTGPPFQQSPFSQYYDFTVTEYKPSPLMFRFQPFSTSLLICETSPPRFEAAS